MIQLRKENVQRIELDLTTMCNASCPLCFRNYKNFPAKYRKPFFRSANAIVSQLDEFSNLRGVELVGQLSEPTTHPQFLDIVEMIKKRGLQIEICTNGSLHDVSYWQQLADLIAVDDRIFFAICGSTQELHSKYRIGTSLEKIILNAKAVRDRKKIDVAKCIMFQYNEDDFKSEQFRNLICQFSHCDFVNTLDQTESNAYNDNFNKMEFAPTGIAKNLFVQIDNLCKIESRLTCKSIAQNHIQIDPYGEIFPCWKYFERTLANGWNQSYDGIINGKKIFCDYCKDIVTSFIAKKSFKI